MKKLATLALALCFLVSCSSKYKLGNFDAPASPLSASESAIVMLPADGVYGSKTYSGSGQTVTQELYTALIPHFKKVEAAKSIESADKTIESAKQNSIRYVFQPEILHWEDRATEWSGIPDKISISYSVWDTQTGEKISTYLGHASSKWATFGGDHPQDLVPHLTQNYIGQIF